MILQIGFVIKYSLEIILYGYIVLNITKIKEYVDGYWHSLKLDHDMWVNKKLGRIIMSVG